MLGVLGDGWGRSLFRRPGGERRQGARCGFMAPSKALVTGYHRLVKMTPPQAFLAGPKADRTET